MRKMSDGFRGLLNINDDEYWFGQMLTFAGHVKDRAESSRRCDEIHLREDSSTTPQYAQRN